MKKTLHLEGGKEENTTELDDDFDNSSDDYNDNESINSEDINVDDYLSDDEIPDYRMHANNYSVMMMKKVFRMHLAHHLHNI